ncbi:MAG: molybdopterin-dependent oxidoreductase [Rhodospirillales bacterium]|nr:molybdopterin-dependent oxidoreductase [Rhodospirillales bacterium]
MDAESGKDVKKVPTYCYNCVAGPDFMKVKVVDGVATEVEGNFDFVEDTPSAGRVCVKPFGLIQKAYNPNRVLTPMKRTNPKKGKDQKPGWVPISWDEALDTVAGKVKEAIAAGPRDSAGYPRIACSFGGGGTPTYYMGTLPAYLSTLGPLDFSFGSGQGVKCYHSEHLYGEFWHRAFTVAPDTPNCNYVLSFGYNVDASGGVCGVKRHADARGRGAKRVQIEPHLSISSGTASEWVPIKAKTDPAFMFALIHVMLHEQRDKLDIPFLKDRTNSPYLIAPNGYYLREKSTKKPLVWDLASEKAVPFDTKGIDVALEGSFATTGWEMGPDDDEWDHDTPVKCQTSFQALCDHMKKFTPLWASRICEIHQKVIRRIAIEFVSEACVGQTIEIEGRTLPYRPVAVALGKTVNSGWGGYECCWSRTLMAVLLGALEVPGGTLGTTVRLNRPATSRQASVTMHPDGFMEYPMNATDKENWLAEPDVRNANRTLVPLGANSPWSVALGPTHLAWMQQEKGPDHWPQATPPDVWFVFRTNPAVSFWDTEQVSKVMAKFPFTVAFAYTDDETNHMADILLPDCTDIEATQLIRVGGTKFIEQFWDKQGFALRQPTIEPVGDAKDMTWITTELAKRTGKLEGYNNAVNRGAHGVPLSGEGYDFSLDITKEHEVDEIWDATCRAASAEITGGEETDGLDWFKEHGLRLKPFSKIDWYLEAELQDQGIRWELPYQERLVRTGKQLGRRLHEKGISWWDEQLEEYEAFPEWKDLPQIWDDAIERNYDVDIKDFPFWLMTSRSMQYNWGSNASLQMIREVASNIQGHGGVIMNTKKAEELGLEEGDWLEIRSPVNATRGHLLTKHGIRPDTLLMIGQFDHWATPYAKEFGAPSMNALIPMLLDLTDATGSSCDLTKVKITKLGGSS